MLKMSVAFFSYPRFVLMPLAFWETCTTSKPILLCYIDRKIYSQNVLFYKNRKTSLYIDENLDCAIVKKLVWRCEFNVGGWKVQLSLELFFKKSNLKYPPQTLIAEHRLKVMNASNKTIIFLFFLDNLLRVDSDGFGGVVCLVDADKPVGELEHVRPQWYDDKLGIAGSLLDVVCNDRNVLEVQSGVDLVHDVQRRRFIVVNSKHLLGNVRSVTKLFCFYLQNRLIQTSQTGGQWYSDTSPFSIPWYGWFVRKVMKVLHRSRKNRTKNSTFEQEDNSEI